VGVRTGQFAAALCVLACSACGVGVGQLAAHTTPAHPAPPIVTSTAPVSESPYAEPSEQLRDLATRFVSIALGYDAWTDARLSFLDQLKTIATNGELRRLQDSERAHLRWWVLRQRLQQVTVQVTGVSQKPVSDDRVRLEVEAVRVTRSTVSTVRDFVAIALVVVRTPDGWRVNQAAGGGL